MSAGLSDYWPGAGIIGLNLILAQSSVVIIFPRLDMSFTLLQSKSRKKAPNSLIQPTPPTS